MDRHKILIKLPSVLPDFKSVKNESKKDYRKENISPKVVIRENKRKSIEFKPREILTSLKSIKIISVTPVPESLKNSCNYTKLFQIIDRETLENFKNRFKYSRNFSSHTGKIREKGQNKHSFFFQYSRERPFESSEKKKHPKIVII